MSFSERLKSERNRLKLTQPQLAKAAGTTKNSQLKYEKGTMCPGADYLQEIARVGVDVQYLLTGVRSNTTFSQEERLMIQLFRDASPEIRKAAFAVLASGGAGNQNITVQGDMSGGIIAHTVNRV